MKTITPFQALKDKPYVIMDARHDRVYDHYRTKDEAFRICADLNSRYGADTYYPAAVDFGEV